MTDFAKLLRPQPDRHPMTQAMIEAILGAKRTTSPFITSLAVTSDGYLQGATSTRANCFFGAASDLKANLKLWCDDTGTSYPAVIAEFRKRFGSADYWRQWG